MSAAGKNSGAAASGDAAAASLPLVRALLAADAASLEARTLRNELVSVATQAKKVVKGTAAHKPFLSTFAALCELAMDMAEPLAVVVGRDVPSLLRQMAQYVGAHSPPQGIGALALRRQADTTLAGRSQQQQRPKRPAAAVAPAPVAGGTAASRQQQQQRGAAPPPAQRHRTEGPPASASRPPPPTFDTLGLLDNRDILLAAQRAAQEGAAKKPPPSPERPPAPPPPPPDSTVAPAPAGPRFTRAGQLIDLSSPTQCVSAVPELRACAAPWLSRRDWRHPLLARHAAALTQVPAPAPAAAPGAENASALFVCLASTGEELLERYTRRRQLLRQQQQRLRDDEPESSTARAAGNLAAWAESYNAIPRRSLLQSSSDSGSGSAAPASAPAPARTATVLAPPAQVHAGATPFQENMVVDRAALTRIAHFGVCGTAQLAQPVKYGD